MARLVLDTRLEEYNRNHDAKGLFARKAGSRVPSRHETVAGHEMTIEGELDWVAETLRNGPPDTIATRRVLVDKMVADLGEAVPRGALGIPETGRVGDLAGAWIAHRQGFDGKPEVRSKDEIDRFVAEGETEFFRGIHPGRGRDAESMAEQFRSGEHYVGQGVFGPGTYAATGRGSWSIVDGATKTPREVASDFANAMVGTFPGRPEMERGRVLRGTIKAGSRVVDYETAKAAMEHDVREATKHVAGGDPRAVTELGRYPAASAGTGMFLGSVGNWAASKGYDAVIVKDQSISAGRDGDQVIILNRTAVRVQATDEVP